MSKRRSILMALLYACMIGGLSACGPIVPAVEATQQIPHDHGDGSM
jgi:hypothetical protein